MVLPPYRCTESVSAAHNQNAKAAAVAIQALLAAGADVCGKEYYGNEALHAAAGNRSGRGGGSGNCSAGGSRADVRAKYDDLY